MVKLTISRFVSSTLNFIRRNRRLGSDIWIFFYIAVVVVATQLILAYRPLGGVYVDGAAIVLLTIMALSREKARFLVISVTVLPVANLLILALPTQPAFTQSVIFYDTLLLLSLIYRYWFSIDQPVNRTSLKLKNYLLLLPLMIIIGQVLGFIGYGLLRHHFAFNHQGSLWLISLAAIIFAFTEEMLFRGLIQAEAMKIMSKVLAGILSAGLYAVLFIDHTSLLPFLFGLIAGSVISAVYYLKPNLVLTTTINASMKLIYIVLLATFVLHK